MKNLISLFFAILLGIYVGMTPAVTTASNHTICAVTTATYAANADAWVDQASTSSNQGTDSILKVQGKATNNFRTLVKFALPATAPIGCVVQTATLRLYAPAWSGGRTLQALPITAAWAENSVTWANQPVATGVAAITTAGSGYRQWDVTNQVQTMFIAGIHHGFLIRDAAESGNGWEQQFHSREKGETMPELVVSFTDAASATPTNTPEPLPTATSTNTPAPPTATPTNTSVPPPTATNTPTSSIIQVTTIKDVIDASDGLLSLREAIILANRWTGDNTIRLPAGLYQTLLLGDDEDAAATGDYDVSDTLLIEGINGAADTFIDGGGLDRLFELFNNASLTLSGVTVRKGMATFGGGVYLQPGTQLIVGGALGAAQLLANEAGENGAGVYNNGGTVLVRQGSAISGNKALGSGGGIFSTNGTVTLDAGIVASNEAGDDGGGIVSLNGAVTLTNGSTIDANRALGAGGGIFNRAGPVTVDAGSSINRNTAMTGDGGGISHLGGGTILVRGASTLLGNAASGNGGAIANADLITLGTVDIRESSVLTGNAAFDGGAVFNVGTLYLRSSRLVGNDTVNDGGAVLNHAEGTVVGVMVMEGGSAIADNACGGEAGGIYNRGILTLAAHSAVTGNYSANGGGGIINDGEMTIAEGSQIVGNASGDSGGAFLINGSASLNGTAAEPILVARNYSSDAFGGLAAVVVGATLNLAYVTFDDNGSSDSGGALVNEGGTVNITHSLFTNNVSSDSGGAIINRPYEEESFIPGVMTISDTAFVSNASADSGGGLINESQVTVTRARFIHNGGGALDNSGNATVVDTEFHGNHTIEDGAAIANTGTIQVTGGIMTANSTTASGGAVANSEDGTLILTSVTIAENSARVGGAIASSNANTTIQSLVLERNRSTEGGGAIVAAGGILELIDVIIRDNTTTIGSGGAIAATGGLGAVNGVVRLIRTTVTGNVAGGDGGGIDIGYLGTVEVLEGSELSDNQAGFSGGGAYVDSGTLTLNATSRIRNNRANTGGGVAMGSNHSVLNLGGALLAEVIFDNHPNNLNAGDGAIHSLLITVGTQQIYLPLIVQ